MNKIVFLNAASINFDDQPDFSPLKELGTFSKYNDSHHDDILEKVANQNVIITKEVPLSKELIEQFPPSINMKNLIFLIIKITIIKTNVMNVFIFLSKGNISFDS